MVDFLKGNFTPKRPVTDGDGDGDARAELEARFERQALDRLGGSIAYVAKRKVLWDDEPTDPVGRGKT